MKIEEAIKELKGMEQMQCDCPECLRRRPALIIAISALEKQTPKEPISLKSMIVKRCPVCKCVAETEYEEYGYCQHCGQALKWGE